MYVGELACLWKNQASWRAEQADRFSSFTLNANLRRVAHDRIRHMHTAYSISARSIPVPVMHGSYSSLNIHLVLS